MVSLLCNWVLFKYILNTVYSWSHFYGEERFFLFRWYCCHFFDLFLLKFFNRSSGISFLELHCQNWVTVLTVHQIHRAIKIHGLEKLNCVMFMPMFFNRLLPLILYYSLQLNSSYSYFCSFLHLCQLNFPPFTLDHSQIYCSSMTKWKQKYISPSPK